MLLFAHTFKLSCYFSFSNFHVTFLIILFLKLLYFVYYRIVNSLFQRIKDFLVRFRLSIISMLLKIWIELFQINKMSCFVRLCLAILCRCKKFSSSRSSCTICCCVKFILTTKILNFGSTSKGCLWDTPLRSSAWSQDWNVMAILWS